VGRDASPGSPTGARERFAGASLRTRVGPWTREPSGGRSRHGTPFLVFRAEGGAQEIVVLDDHAERLAIGRRGANDIALTWDPEVSGLHAAMERLGAEWTLLDDGLSKNGSFVNGVLLRFGDTVVAYCAAGRSATTHPTAGPQDQVHVRPPTEAQRRVLVPPGAAGEGDHAARALERGRALGGVVVPGRVEHQLGLGEVARDRRMQLVQKRLNADPVVHVYAGELLGGTLDPAVPVRETVDGLLTLRLGHDLLTDEVQHPCPDEPTLFRRQARR
jgi:hypothetical protein